MSLINPTRVFDDVLLIAAPHMDDGVLACGGTIAQLPHKERIHVVYVTDGMKSPAPEVPWRDSITLDLGATRMREAVAAMGCLGVPEENLHFLGLAEGKVAKEKQALDSSMRALISRIRPTHILMPFRYDRHADHLALNHSITAAYNQGLHQMHLIEYFVYYRWRLLPERDVRKYIYPQFLLEVDIRDVSAQKRAALDCFKSQTTRYYSWQSRPILTPVLLDEVCRTPEFFLRYDASVTGPAAFARSVTWIRVVHRLEPIIKKWKDRAVALWVRGLHRGDREGK